MQDKHTPGPWTVAIHEHTSGLARGLRSGWVHGPAGHIEVAVPDARLIAAAPEQHELLQTFTEWARQLAARDDLPKGIRSAAANLHDDGKRLLAKAAGSTP